MNPKLLLCLPLVLSIGLANDKCHAAIIFSKQAEECRAIAYQETISFYHHANRGFAPKNFQIDKLNVTNGFRWYWFDDRSVLSGKLFPSTDSTPLAWNYMMMCGTNMVGMMGLAWETNHWSFVLPIYSGAALKGQQDSIWVGLEKAERLPQVKNRNYEFRYLTYANMDFPMIWLHGKSDDILFPISDGCGKWKAYNPYSEEQMVKLLKPGIKRDIAVWKKSDGEHQKNAANSPAKVKLKFVSVDSEETNAENGCGENAVDGNPNTIWHTQWYGKSPGLPHGIVIELVPPTVIKGFTYLPRQDESDHGTIKDFEFYVSNDGKHWGQPVKAGTFGPGKGEKIETFNPVKCRFIKLKAISEIHGEPWTSAAEIGVIQKGEAASAKDYWRGNVGPIPARHNSHVPDAIDSFVAAFLANGGLWLNGSDGPDLFATSPQRVVLETLRTAHFASGMMMSYRILDLRKVRIGEFGIYTAVLADTNLGEMIVLVQKSSKPGYWWRRIYDAHPPYQRLY